MRLKGKGLHINIHSHQFRRDENVFQLLNLFPNEIEDKATNKVVYSAGIHPWYLDNADEQITILEKYVQHPNFISIGEIGLDRVKHQNFDEQLKVFENQLKLAEKDVKPVIIHCVKAYSDILYFRKKYPRNNWIIHDFNANDVIVSELIQNNCYLSFGNNFMKEGSKANRLFEFVPLDKIFLETDENANLSIEQVYQYAAEVKSIDIEELRQQIIKNFNSIFGEKL